MTVSPAYSGPVPTGTVLVKKSTTTLCTITLSAAKGSCSLTASELPARTFSVYASYARTANFYGSLATKSLTVMKASTKTTLKLSSAKVTLGQEQLERLTVTVSPEYPGTAGRSGHHHRPRLSHDPQLWQGHLHPFQQEIPGRSKKARRPLLGRGQLSGFLVGEHDPHGREVTDN